ncbi:MAG: hydroxymethylbilane synthase [Alphaproteobacteria bacterium]|nr:MAG: hydroxymethylbilane synthase [Alphaproteobacteria bacterium]
MQRTIRIGTRGSQLALTQARMVQALLGKAHGVFEVDFDQTFPIHVIKTSGDKIQDRALNAIGGKGLFTKEIEEALLSGEVDIAVHSMKDMPTQLPDGLALDCMLERADPRDAFISDKAASVAELPEGAVVGSTSLRRQAQLKALRPDLKVVTYRGNVDTRLRKLKEGEVDATLLAMAGLTRLGLTHEVTAALSVEDMIPAPAQGVIGIERRAEDTEIADLLAPLDHLPSRLAAEAERALLKVLDGSCRTPIGAYARVAGDQMRLDAVVLMPDGSKTFRGADEGVATLEGALALGERVGQDLRAEAGEAFFKQLAEAL